MTKTTQEVDNIMHLSLKSIKDKKLIEHLKRHRRKIVAMPKSKRDDDPEEMNEEDVPLSDMLKDQNNQ